MLSSSSISLSVSTLIAQLEMYPRPMRTVEVVDEDSTAARDPNLRSSFQVDSKTVCYPHSQSFEQRVAHRIVQPRIRPIHDNDVNVGQHRACEHPWEGERWRVTS